MSPYNALIETMAKAPSKDWHHPLGYKHSTCTVNGVKIVLYDNGWINFANKIYMGWPFSKRKGRALYRRVRENSGVRDAQQSLERELLAKIGFTEE